MAAAVISFVLVLVAAAAAFVIVSMRRSGKDRVAVSRDVASIGTSAPLRGAETGKDAQTATVSGTASGRSPYDRIKNRFAALGVLIAAVFGSLAVKLWIMQVLSADRYRTQSEDNQLTTIKTPASRGRIFDADGIELVGNETVPTVLADASVANDHNVLVRLSALLGIPYSIVRQRIQDASGGAQAQREVATHPRERDVAFISEHPDAFPGITIENRSHRTYPYGALACQLLGYSGTIAAEELERMPVGTDYQSGDEVGKSGVEAAFENVLSGEHGERVVVADVDGTVHSVERETRPTQGNDVHLTIAARVQQAAENALIGMIAPEGVIGGGTGTAGAIVAMDVTNGDVLAMASFPNYDPANFIGGISQDDWDRYNADLARKPLINRCIAGTYPAASTFKAFVGMAALHYGIASSDSGWNCTGTWTGFGDKYAQKCWKEGGHGYLDLRGGVVNSCDVVFYDIAAQFYYRSDDLGETPMQDFAMKFGMGSKTGIILSGEEAGNVPTPEWKKKHYANQPEEGQWVPGDMTNTAIGQGNVLVTPLQLAVGYAGVATGKLPTPNLLKEVRNSAGETVVTGTSKLSDIEGVNDAEYSFMRDALRGVALEDGDVPETLAKAGGFQCACKTGTGEATGDRDAYSWFVMYAPYDDPKYVVSCVIEDGGYGADTACPVAADVMEACVEYGAGTLDAELTYVSEITRSIEYVAKGMAKGGE